MRKLLLSVTAATLAIGLLTSPARATFTDGNDLLTSCSADLYVECLGYVAGIADAMETAQSCNNGSLAGWQACVPIGVRKSQAKDVVIRFLREHPQDRHYPASGLVAQALQEAFPCRRS